MRFVIGTILFLVCSQGQARVTDKVIMDSCMWLWTVALWRWIGKEQHEVLYVFVFLGDGNKKERDSSLWSNLYGEYQSQWKPVWNQAGTIHTGHIHASQGKSNFDRCRAISTHTGPFRTTGVDTDPFQLKWAIWPNIAAVCSLLIIVVACLGEIYCLFSIGSEFNSFCCYWRPYWWNVISQTWLGIIMRTTSIISCMENDQLA